MDLQADLVSQVEKLRKDIFLTRCVFWPCTTLSRGSNCKLEEASSNRRGERISSERQSGNVAARLGQESFEGACLTLMAMEKVDVASLCVQDEGGSSLNLHNLKSESQATLTPGFYIYEPMGRFDLLRP